MNNPYYIHLFFVRKIIMICYMFVLILNLIDLKINTYMKKLTHNMYTFQKYAEWKYTKQWEY